MCRCLLNSNPNLYFEAMIVVQKSRILFVVGQATNGKTGQIYKENIWLYIIVMAQNQHGNRQGEKCVQKIDKNRNVYRKHTRPEMCIENR